jgi:two-component system, LytTR family, response regulator
MKPLTAIVIDDEENARDLLSGIITDHVSGVKVIAQAATAEQGINLILTEFPDIVFLDIDMPGKNGFEVAKVIGEQKLACSIIFVTAFNQFAIDAIKFAAFDYLLKPVNLEELKACIARLLGSKRVENLQQSVDKLLNALNAEKLNFHNRTGSIFIDPLTIVYCEAEGNYTDIFLDSGIKQTVTHNISAIETQLEGRGFSRISRSTLINRRFLTQIKRKDKKCILNANDFEYQLSIKGTFIKKIT